MAAFKSSGIAFSSYESRLRRDTSFHHFASVASGGSELATGSNNGSINAAFSARRFRLEKHTMVCCWQHEGHSRILVCSRDRTVF
jgi:hypothetical protein